MPEPDGWIKWGRDPLPIPPKEVRRNDLMIQIERWERFAAERTAERKRAEALLHQAGSNLATLRAKLAALQEGL